MKAKEQYALYGIRSENVLLQPFLKWAGGKRKLLPFINKNIAEDFHVYHEPFLGAGAVFFNLHPNRAVVNDINSELVNTYKVIKEYPGILIDDLKKHKNTKEYFYKIREIDRKRDINSLCKIQRASRFIYLNKTCFNGLYRVNSKGQFNTPYGDYNNPTYIQKSTILAINKYLNNNNIELLNMDFAKALKKAKANDFVYLDPPYDPLSITSSFTSYDSSSFGKEEQIRLYDAIEVLSKKHCKIMLSNSDTSFIRKLYKNYNIITIKAGRSINSNGNGRGKINELLILNYEPGNKK